MFCLDFSVLQYSVNVEQVLESEDPSSKGSSFTYHLPAKAVVGLLGPKAFAIWVALLYKIESRMNISVE